MPKRAKAAPVDPGEPTPTPVDPVEQLARQADQAQRMRTLTEHADVVALRVERVRTHVERILWVAIGLGLAFTVPNVHAFYVTVTDAVPSSVLWWSGWLVEPMLALVLIAILRAEQITNRHGERLTRGPQTLKWGGVAATYLMNTWAHWTHGDAAGIVAHSVPPIIVLVAAAAMPAVHESLTRSTTAAHHRAAQRQHHLTTADAEPSTNTGPSVNAGPSVLEVAATTTAPRTTRKRSTKKTANAPTNTTAGTAANTQTNKTSPANTSTTTADTAANTATNGATNAGNGAGRWTARDYAALAAEQFTGADHQDARWVREVTGCGKTASYEVLRILHEPAKSQQRPDLYAVGHQ